MCSPANDRDLVSFAGGSPFSAIAGSSRKELGFHSKRRPATIKAVLIQAEDSTAV